MTTFKDKLKKICNYSEENKSMPPNVSVSYMDFVYENDELKREIKRKHRNLAIDTVLDEVEENGDYSESNVSECINNDSSMDTISPKIMSLHTTAQNYLDDEELYNKVIDFLKVNTTQKHTMSISLDYVATNNPHSTLEENIQINFRKIVTKIMHASNYIAIEGRVGPATAVIVGKNNWHWFNENNVVSNNMLGSFSLILDESISPDKIIVARANNNHSPGLILVNNLFDNSCYFKETPNWEKQYVWFNVK